MTWSLCRRCSDGPAMKWWAMMKPGCVRINTCAVTARSEQKLARRSAGSGGKPAALIAPRMLCSGSPRGGQALPEVDLVFGIGERGQLAELVQDCAGGRASSLPGGRCGGFTAV